MRPLLHALGFGLLLLVAPAAALEIVSVSPGAAPPGATVTIAGGPFGAQVRVVLGGRKLAPARLGQRELAFTVPALDEGEYALSLREGTRTSPRPFTFRVISPAPVIRSLHPTNIDECSTEEQRRVVVEGVHFHPGAKVLLDGKVVPHARSGETTLNFTVPPLPAGIYGVQVVNPDERKSLPHSLWFNNLPEITSVRQGEDFVNYYELVIEGKNFSYSSALVVSEYPVGFFDLPPQQRTVTSQGSGPDPVQGRSISDNLYFVDCHTLIYNRYPYSTQPKQVILQIINPDGKKTATYSVSIP
jgi:hypothetical protein